MQVQARFGLRVPTFPADGSEQKQFLDQILTYMARLEKSFDSAWLDDHFVPWAVTVGKAAPTLESFTTISYLSGIFQKMLFGNIVLCNSYRNPSLLAKMGATLQSLTKGRFILGIGAGWKEDEYVAYGYDFPPPKIRIEQLDEAVQIIRKMWTEKETTFKGRYFRIEKAYCYPKPDPIPPIMIGGGGEKLTLRIVARHADWWNIANVSPQTYEHKLKVLEAHCKREGREPSTITKTLANMVAISETEEKANSIASKSLFIQKSDEENYIIGNPDTVLERLMEYAKLDIKYFILRFVDFPRVEGAKLFVDKVIPKMRCRGS